MEVVERYKISIQKATQKAEVDSVRKLTVQIIDLQVDLVEVLVDEGDQRLLDHHQLVGSMIEQSVESVSFASHSDIVIAASQFLGDDPGGEDTLPLGHDHHCLGRARPRGHDPHPATPSREPTALTDPSPTSLPRCCRRHLREQPLP